MAKIILNNKIETGNEAEATRDGYFARRPEGHLEICQTLPAAILRHTAELERLSGFTKSGLAIPGTTVEVGPYGIGEFVEKVSMSDKEKLDACKAAMLAAGLDPEKAIEDARAARGDKESGARLRAWEVALTEKKGIVKDANLPKGRQVSPAPAGAAAPAPEAAPALEPAAA